MCKEILKKEKEKKDDQECSGMDDIQSKVKSEIDIVDLQLIFSLHIHAYLRSGV